MEEFGSTSPCTENKMGGMAYAQRHQVVDAYRSMPHLGYTHLLQIGQDGLSPAGFPWDPGYLNVWSMDPLDPNTYRSAFSNERIAITGTEIAEGALSHRHVNSATRWRVLFDPTLLVMVVIT